MGNAAFGLAADAIRQTERRTGGCCADTSLGVRTYTFSARNSAGEDRSLVRDANQLRWATDDSATIISVAYSDNGTVTLEFADDMAVAVVDGAVRVGNQGKTPFVMEPVARLGTPITLRTADGRYLCVSEPGGPVSLTASAGSNTEFLMERKDQFGARWAADEDYPRNENHSTHLWIFNRAKELIGSLSSLGSGEFFRNSYSEDLRVALRWILNTRDFREGVMQGIYDADNKGESNPYTAGFIYSAHFYNPKTGRGGSWDPHNDKNNALAFGKYYFTQSLTQSDAYQSGYNLGLCIHYLEDLTQPMHCADYRNDVFDWRHESYETWALGMQNGWVIQEKDLDELDIPVMYDNDWVNYFAYATDRSVTEFEKWKASSKSPIGSETPGARHASPPGFANEWVPGASGMVKFAQRLVTNLLLTWCSQARYASKYRGLPSVEDKVILFPAVHDKIAGAGRDQTEEDGITYYHIAMQPGAREAWALEPVLENGKPVFEGANQVYHLRNRGLNKCIVAGDHWDGHVYLQDPGAKKNAQWTLEPTTKSITRTNGKTYPGYRVRDREHKKYLAVNTWVSINGPMDHDDKGTECIVVPAADY